MHPDLDPELLQRLRSLPDATPPPYGYVEFAHRYSRRRVRRAQAPLRLMAVAVAVVVAGWVMKHGLAPMMADIAPVSRAPQARPWHPHALTPARPLLAANAERWLNEQPRAAIVQVPTQMAVTELEDQIAAMDDQLNAVRLSRPQAQQVVALQQDRAQLVESLAQVRYAQILVAGVQ
jgi:TolA-binding protein